MDAISYSYADKAQKRIKRFIENPDSNSGVLTQPKVIEVGETVTIKNGRQAILADTVVDGDLVIEAGGDVFVPAGAGFGDLESQIALKADTSYVNGKYSGFKNYIINGNMVVAQRGDGPFTVNGAYNIDQWFSHISSTGSNITRMETGISYAQVYVVSGTATITLEQRLEFPRRFSGKTLTLSYKLFNGDYTGNTIPYCISLAHAGGRTILYTGTHTFDSINRKKFTFTMPDLSGYTLNANSYLEIRPVEVINKGHTGVFGIAQVQLEEGSVATPFENRPIGLELSLCQRYYETGLVSIWQGQSDNYRSSSYLNFKNQKRVPPSISLSFVENNGYGAPTAEWTTTNGFNYAAISNTSTADGRVTSIFIASSEL